MAVATAEGYARMKVRLVEAAAEYGNTLESVCRRGGSSSTRIESAHFRGDFRDILTCSRRPRSMALLSKMRLVEAAAQYGTMHEVRLVDAAAQHGLTLGNASLQGGREQGATLDHASRRGGRGVWR